MEVFNLYQQTQNSVIINLDRPRDFNGVYATKIRIDLLQVILKQRAIICMSYLDVNDSVVSTSPLILEFDNYADWASDDEYIVNYIQNNA